MLKGYLHNKIVSSATAILIVLTLLSMPAVAYADDPIPPPNNGNCVACHEDLYFLHDTGNWYCLNESPMACVDCHGGNPNTLDKDLAHNDRAEHPVINEDVTKCQQCHPGECYDRVELFDRTAGISDILVAAPYTPQYSTGNTDSMSVNQPKQMPINMLVFWEIIPLLLVAGLAAAIYIILRRRKV